MTACPKMHKHQTYKQNLLKEHSPTCARRLCLRRSESLSSRAAGIVVAQPLCAPETVGSLQPAKTGPYLMLTGGLCKATQPTPKRIQLLTHQTRTLNHLRLCLLSNPSSVSGLPMWPWARHFPLWGLNFPSFKMGGWTP